MLWETTCMMVPIFVLNRIPETNSLWVCQNCEDYWWESRDCEVCNAKGELVASPKQTVGCNMGDMFGADFLFHKQMNRHIKKNILWAPW